MINKLILVLAVICCAPCIAQGKTVVAPSDFTFLGGFRAPTSASYPSGLTYRYKGGQLYLYTMSTLTPTKGNLIEFQAPATLGQTLPFPQTTIQQNYGDIFQDTLRDVVSNGSGGSPPYIGIAGGATRPSGIFWDETDQRMYWTKVIDYNTDGSTSDTGIGYSNLDDTAHTGTGIGSWKLSPTVANGGRSSRWGFSMCAIPSWFATAYTGGKRLGVGFGGGTSIVSNGPPSIGPTIFAIDPINPVAQGLYDYMNAPPHEIMSALNGEGRGIRNPLYPGFINRDDIWNGSIDRWFESDTSFHGVWIDGTNKHGLVIFAQMGAGSANTVINTEIAPTKTTFTVDDPGDIGVNDYIKVSTDYNPDPHYNFESCFVEAIISNLITVKSCRAGNNEVTPTLTGNPIPGGQVMAGNWYTGGGDVQSRVWNPWYIYDPADLALSAQDPVANPPQDILPVYNENVPFPGLTYPGPGLQQGTLKNHRYNPRGATFDSTTNKLYVATFEPDGGQNIYVYQFNDTPSGGDTTSPTVTNFTIPSTATSLTVQITTFTASDNVAVTGYLITESTTPPSSGATGWTGSAPTSYTFASAGVKTLYAWAKDAAGNVSAVFASQTVVITLPVTSGTCGTSNTQSFLTAPTTGLCSTGTASAVTGSGPWSWTCAGSGGGSTASCSATLLEIPSGGASAAVACSAIAGFR